MVVLKLVDPDGDTLRIREMDKEHYNFPVLMLNCEDGDGLHSLTVVNATILRDYLTKWLEQQ